MTTTAISAPANAIVTLMTKCSPNIDCGRIGVAEKRLSTPSSRKPPKVVGMMPSAVIAMGTVSIAGRMSLMTATP